MEAGSTFTGTQSTLPPSHFGPSRSPFTVFLLVATLWSVFLIVYASFRLGQPPHTRTAWASTILTLALASLAGAFLAAALYHTFGTFVRRERSRRIYAAIQSLATGLVVTWSFLSLVKFQATRAHLGWVDLRFLAGSIRQVGSEASRAEFRLFLVAAILPLVLATAVFLGLRRSRPPAFARVPRLAASFALATLGLSIIAWREPYAKFLWTTVNPVTSVTASSLIGRGSLDLGPSRPFVPDPDRHRQITAYAASPSFRRANVLVVMLESVPWSRLFGPLARRESTPNLLELATQSQQFDRAYATATHSDYAQTSILSSLHPRRFERHDFFADLSYPRTLLWDLFAPLGYRTAMFSCQNEDWGNMASFLRTPGLQTFRHAPDWPTAARRGRESSSKVFEETPIRAFLQWLHQGPRTPFVAYLNLQATHYPYVVPPGVPQPYLPAEIDFESTFVSYPHDKIPVMLNRFHNALAYVDFAVGKLVEGLQEAGAWEDTVLVVVSDHGEAFYEHGMPTHGSSLFEEQLRTALFVRLPGVDGRVIQHPVSVLDVLPSTLRWMGLPEHGNWQGRSDIFDPHYAFSGDRPIPFTIQGMTREDGLLLGDWKLTLNREWGTKSLFHLTTDPREHDNLASRRPEVVSELERKLADLLFEQLAYYRERAWERGYYPPRLP